MKELTMLLVILKLIGVKSFLTPFKILKAIIKLSKKILIVLSKTLDGFIKATEEEFLKS